MAQFRKQEHPLQEATHMGIPRASAAPFWKHLEACDSAPQEVSRPMSVLKSFGWTPRSVGRGSTLHPEEPCLRKHDFRNQRTGSFVQWTEVIPNLSFQAKSVCFSCCIFRRARPEGRKEDGCLNIDWILAKYFELSVSSKSVIDIEHSSLGTSLKEMLICRHLFCAPCVMSIYIQGLCAASLPGRHGLKLPGSFWISPLLSRV